MRALGVLVLLGLTACNRGDTRSADERDRDEYIEDVMAFTDQTRDAVIARMKEGSVPLKREWEEWEAAGPMTEARIREFYKQTASYIYELGAWHLDVADKRQSDVAFFAGMKQRAPTNVLDFGGGVGLIALPLAREGIDVTLADLDSTSLNFAVFRAKRHGVKLKIWRSDVEPMPPDATYDVILALDVLEHLPPHELETTVDKLVKLEHPGTQVVMSAPFGRTATHPMHRDEDAQSRAQVDRLMRGGR